MADPTIALTRRATAASGFQRGMAVTTKRGKLKPDVMLVHGKEVPCPHGQYVIRVTEDRKARYINVGTDPEKALEEFDRYERTIKAKHSLSTVGIEVNLPVGIKDRDLRAYAKEFLGMKEMEPHRSEFAVAAYRLAIDEFIDYSHRIYPVEVTTSDLLGFAQWITKGEGRSDTTRSHRMARLFAFLRYAGVDLEQILTAQQKKALLSKPKKLVEKYSEEDLRQLMNAADRPYSKMVFLIAMHSGFRDQELMFFKWTPDVDFERNVIRVTAKPAEGFIPKDCEEREVPMSPKLKEGLQTWRKLNPNTKYVIGSQGDRPNTKLLKMLKGVARRAGMNCGQCKGCKGKSKECGRFKLHKFRATWISNLLIALHGDLPTVMKLAGHEDIATTAKYLAPSQGPRLQLAVTNLYPTLH